MERRLPPSAEAQRSGMPRRWRRSPARNDVYGGKPDADSPGVSAGTLGFAAADQWSALRECGRAADSRPYGLSGARTIRWDEHRVVRPFLVSSHGRDSSSARRRQPLRQLPGGRRQLTPSLAQGRLDRIPRHFCGDRIRAGPEGGPTAWLASPTGGKS